jgi:hypothetical protein
MLPFSLFDVSVVVCPVVLKPKQQISRFLCFFYYYKINTYVIIGQFGVVVVTVNFVQYCIDCTSKLKDTQR